MMPHIDGFNRDRGNPQETKTECRFFRNLGELVNLADGYRRDADSSRRKDGEGGCTYWFRGEEAFFPDLQPGLFRSGVEHESELYQSALGSAPERFRGLESVFDRLTLMRHYGYPVRLLDISQNILTAWFMALDAWRSVRNDIACAVRPGNPYFSGHPFPCPRISVIRVPDSRVKAAESDLVTNLGMLAKVGDEFSFGKLWHEVRQERRGFDEGAFWDSVDEMFGNWCVKPRISNTRVDMQQGALRPLRTAPRRPARRAGLGHARRAVSAPQVAGEAVQPHPPDGTGRAGRDLARGLPRPRRHGRRGGRGRKPGRAFPDGAVRPGGPAGTGDLRRHGARGLPRQPGAPCPVLGGPLPAGVGKNLVA